MSSKSPQYLEVVANAFKTAQAWRMATFVLSGVVAVLAFSLVSQARNTPVVLVPYDLAANGKNMTVTTNGEIRGTSVEYMANIGLADLALILNFTPDNVLSQTQRFLNRTTESLYGAQRETLLAQAAEFKSRNVSQSFYPADVKLSADGSRVEIVGTQIRWMGGKDTFRQKVTYILSYKVFKGFLHIADLRQKTDEAPKTEGAPNGK